MRDHGWSLCCSVMGWAAVEKALEDMAAQECDGAQLLCSTSRSYVNGGYVLYKYACAFKNSHKCMWSCRVRVPFERNAESQEGCGAPARKDLRATVHATHLCHVEVNSSSSHANHRGEQETEGACAVFKAAAQVHHDMFGWTSAQIATWLSNHKIDIKNGDSLAHMVHRCRRYGARCRKLFLHADIPQCMDAGSEIATFIEARSFANVLQRPDFHTNMTYVLPGSIACPSGVIIMLTTINCVLNLARSMQWHDLWTPGFGPVAGLDHTFKVMSHAFMRAADDCRKHARPCP